MRTDADAGKSSPYYLTVLRRRWRVAVAILLACVAGAVAYIALATPKYQSEVQLFVATRPSLGQDSQALYNGGQFTQGRVLSYVALVTSPSVTGPVIRNLGLHMSEKQLASELSASVPIDTVLINVTATDASASRSQAIAAAVANQLIRLINRLEQPGPGTSPVTVSISAPALLPHAPASPRKKLTIAIAIVLGALLAFGAALIRDRLDTTLRTPADLEAASGLPVLAVLPMVPKSNGTRRSREIRKTRDEAVRQLRTNLQFVDVDEPIDAIVVTSALPHEGKSTVALALAQLTAETGRTVTLVDGDLRRPALMHHAAIGAARGLTDALIADEDIDEFLLIQESSNNLRILTAGSPVPNPSEILSSARFASLLNDLRGRSDLVVIDAPPLLPVADAALLAALVSGAILVSEVGRTRRRELEIALGRLSSVGARTLGIVANKVRRGAFASYYGYRYGNYDYEADSQDKRVRRGLGG